MTFFCYCGNYQIRITYGVIISEDFRIGGLVTVLVFYIRDDAVLFVYRYIVRFQLRYFVRIEVKRYNYRVGWYDKFIVFYRYWTSTFLGIRFFKTRAQETNFVDVILFIQFKRYRLDVKFEVGFFFAGVFYFFFRVWYVSFITTISVGDVIRVVAQCGTYIVYRGVVVVQYYDVKFGGIDKRFFRQFFEFYYLFSVGNEERQRVINVRRIFIG